jgi:pimeloyl-ACP methyl ester carboxylesterase
MTPEATVQAEALLWGAFASIDVPIQIIRGQLSDLLSEQTCEKMLEIQPRARLAQIPGVGHAPSLMSPEQIALVSDFLLSHDDCSSPDARK